MAIEGMLAYCTGVPRVMRGLTVEIVEDRTTQLLLVFALARASAQRVELRSSHRDAYVGCKE